MESDSQAKEWLKASFTYALKMSRTHTIDTSFTITGTWSEQNRIYLQRRPLDSEPYRVDVGGRSFYYCIDREEMIKPESIWVIHRLVEAYAQGKPKQPWDILVATYVFCTDLLRGFVLVSVRRSALTTGGSYLAWHDNTKFGLAEALLQKSTQERT